MLRKMALALALVLSFAFVPITAQPAQANNCLSAADSYAQSPDNFGYKYMYDCYKAAGLTVTEGTCSSLLREAIANYRLSFASSGFNAIVKYDRCRAKLPSSSSSGGTSTGSSAGSGTSTGVVGPGCTAAPEKPILSFKNTLTELKISLGYSPTGQSANRIAYTMNYYDSVAKKWLGWSAWSFASGGTELTLTQPTPDQTKVAFDSIAQNPCGNSARSRLDVDNKGIKIVNPPVDEISQVVSAVNVGVAVRVSQLVSTLSGQSTVARVTTPKTCQIVGENLTARAAGICTVSITSAGTTELAPKTTAVNIKMTAPTRTITCVSKRNSKVIRKVTAINPKCPAGFSVRR